MKKPPKAYSYFKTSQDIAALGLTQIREKLFLTSIDLVQPSQLLLAIMQAYHNVPLQSEKAKSEILITPILNEIRLNNIQKMTYFSGYLFQVEPEKGLTGFCDFIISRKANAVCIESPIIAVVEAKHNQDLLDAIPQCVAEMYAAQQFNQKNNLNNNTNNNTNIIHNLIYGAITNGYEWIFVSLENQLVRVDTERYGLKNLPELLGIWQKIIDVF